MKNKRYLILFLVVVCIIILGGCSNSRGASVPNTNAVFAPEGYNSSGVSWDNTIKDAKSLTNTITQSAMSGVITIYSEYYSTVLGLTISGTNTSQGSGFIIAYDGGIYYALTNSHVVARDSDFTEQSIYIEDYKGNVYDAEIYHKPTAVSEAISTNYDLACICFEAPKGLNVFEFTSVNPEIGDEVILLGSPQGQVNAILYGEVNGYITPIFDDEDNQLNIQFNVIKNSINSKNGSSGGPLLDGNLRVVGVHFGGGEQGNVKYSGAIPVEKVREFLDDYVWTKSSSINQGTYY